MVSLLKTFARGILYVLGLPFFILALLIFAVIGLFAFLFQAIKSIIYFFTGQRFFPELPEDKELRLLKEKQNVPLDNEPQLDNEKDIIMHYQEPQKAEEEKEDLINNLTNEPTPTVVQEEVKASPLTVEEACFKPTFETEEKKEEVNEEDIHEEMVLNDFIKNSEPEIEETPQNVEDEEENVILETVEKKESEEDLVEELETYIPRSSNYSATEEDEDNDNGVDIDYNVR